MAYDKQEYVNLTIFKIVVWFTDLFFFSMTTDIFIDETAKIWKNSKAHECSPCMCTIDSGCGHSCQNRSTLYECNDNNCRLGAEHCRNRSFEELRRRTKGGNKYDIGVDVFKTENKGYGVRSNRTFEPGQIIVEYAGEVITQEECEKRMRSIYKKNQVSSIPLAFMKYFELMTDLSPSPIISCTWTATWSLTRQEDQLLASSTIHVNPIAKWRNGLLQINHAWHCLLDPMEL